MTTKEVEHKGDKYWITIEPAVHSTTKETGFIAYVSNEPPKALFIGNSVKDNEGRTMFFGDELTALTNARAVLESY
jgi:hypothetical protein